MGLQVLRKLLTNYVGLKKIGLDLAKIQSKQDKGRVNLTLTVQQN